jgi:hypothetical protein
LGAQQLRRQRRAIGQRLHFHRCALLRRCGALIYRHHHCVGTQQLRRKR